jgi:hypothetical protein
MFNLLKRVAQWSEDQLDGLAPDAQRHDPGAQFLACRAATRAKAD